MDKQFIYEQRSVKSSTVWLMFLFLGWSYGNFGKMGKQIFYYLTLGGVGLWAIYKLFTLNRDIKEYNRKVALEVGYDTNDLLKLGLV